MLLFYLFDKNMTDTRSEKSKADEVEQNFELIQIIISKFNELKQDLITGIKSLIQLEVEQIARKPLEEFNVIIFKLQEQIATLELEKDDLEQHGRRVCVRINDVLVKSEESPNSVYEIVGELLREALAEMLTMLI